MTPLEGFKELREFAGKAGSANMLMAAADSEKAEDGTMVFQRLSLTDEVSGDFLKNVVSTLGKDGSEPAFRDYAAGYAPSSYELCYVKLADHEPVSAMLDSVSDIGGAGIFKEEDDIINRLRFYAIVAENKSRQKSAFLRLYSPKKELTRSHWTALWQRNDKYDHVKRKIFLFDDKFDCFSWKDYLFIRHVGNFQEIFGYFAELVAKGEKAIGDVVSKVQIKNVDDFVEGCKADSRMLARLAQIVRKPYFKSLTMLRSRERSRNIM